MAEGIIPSSFSSALIISWIHVLQFLLEVHIGEQGSNLHIASPGIRFEEIPQTIVYKLQFTYCTKLNLNCVKNSLVMYAV